jgi:6-phosphogluconolactonase
MLTLQVYIGTFTQEIFLCHFDLEKGCLDKVAAFDSGSSPAFLALSLDGRFLYCVNEVNQFQGQQGGGVSAFKVKQNNGELTYLNSQSSLGAIPCYISLDQTGKWALVSNYTGGNVALFPLNVDGSLQPASDCVQHLGHGTNPERQEAAHPHSIRMNPDNRLAMAVDLGLDRIHLYALDPSRGKLLPHDPPVIDLPSGAGPRHLDFHPNGRWLYVLNELDSTLVTYQYSAQAGVYLYLQTVSTLPQGYSETNWPADLHVHPGGRFVIGTNRGHDGLAVFAIDPDDGQLSLTQIMPSGGKMPINFAFDPTGKWVIVANQTSNNLTVFAFDETQGKLIATDEQLVIPSPACVKFGPSQ